MIANSFCCRGPWQNFPAMSTWVGTFDALFEKNKASMRSTGSTADDVGRINVAIREAAKIGVDERVILSIIMQGGYKIYPCLTALSSILGRFRESSLCTLG